jgi:uncharacterized protein
VSSGLPSREQAIELLHKTKCSPQVIKHCIAVADIAVETARDLACRGLKVNIELVEIGALLHDLGRSKNHTVNHALIGAQIAQSMGLPEHVINIIKRHVGAGITTQEAQSLGWPKDIYMPQTLEEKIVCYADKLIDHGKRIPIEIEIEKLQKANKKQAAERVRKLNKEITTLLGNKP